MKIMKYIILGLVLSISVHLLIFNTVKVDKIEFSDKKASSKNVTKSNINYVTLKAKPKPEPKKIIKKTAKKEIKKVKQKPKKPIKKKELKKKDFKKVVKKEIKPQKKREVKKKLLKPKTEAKPLEKKEAIPNYTKLNPTKFQKNNLEKILANPPKEEPELIDELTKSYIKLYGDEYKSFTKVQKVYLKRNLKNIGMITQKYLKYPRIAVRTRQSGTNVIEFILHPNGDITKPIITSSSGYESLDENTIKTIEIAYKDYPRPKEPTKIRIYVNYKLY